MSASRSTIPSILIVDDEEAICVLLKIKLESMGCVTQIAHNGEQALELLREGSVDVVITDQDMPGMKGTELYKRATLLYAHLHARFVFITGNSGLTEADFPGRLVHKPFELSVLGEAVQDMLTRTKRPHPARC